MDTFDWEALPKLIRYVPETGKMYWKERTAEMFADSDMPITRASWWNSRYANKEALIKVVRGERHGRIFHRQVRASRIAFYLAHGRIPRIVGFANGDKFDLSKDNLIELTQSDVAKERERRIKEERKTNSV